MQTITTPKTIAQVKALENHFTAKSFAQAAVKAATYLEAKAGEGGPVLSNKLFVEGNNIVYEYYQLTKRHNHVYVIF